MGVVIEGLGFSSLTPGAWTRVLIDFEIHVVERCRPCFGLAYLDGPAERIDVGFVSDGGDVYTVPGNALMRGWNNSVAFIHPIPEDPCWRYSSKRLHERTGYRLFVEFPKPGRYRLAVFAGRQVERLRVRVTDCYVATFLVERGWVASLPFLAGATLFVVGLLRGWGSGRSIAASLATALGGMVAEALLGYVPSVVRGSTGFEVYVHPMGMMT